MTNGGGGWGGGFIEHCPLRLLLGGGAQATLHPYRRQPQGAVLRCAGLGLPGAMAEAVSQRTEAWAGQPLGGVVWATPHPYRHRLHGAVLRCAGLGLPWAVALGLSKHKEAWAGQPVGGVVWATPHPYKRRLLGAALRCVGLAGAAAVGCRGLLWPVVDCTLFWKSHPDA